MKGITVFKICILGGISSDIRQEIYFLRRHERNRKKRYFRPYIQQDTSPNKILNMVIPVLMYFCSFLSN